MGKQQKVDRGFVRSEERVCTSLLREKAMFNRLVSRCVRWLPALAMALLIVSVLQEGTLGDVWEKKTPPTMNDMTSATKIAAPDGTANTRTTIGLGELVTCTIDSSTWRNVDHDETTGQDVADTIGNRVWASSAGGSISPTGVTTVDSTTLTAGNNPSTAVVVLVNVYDSQTRYIDAPITKSITFTVIKPTGETTVDHGWNGSIAQFQSTLTPKSACFSKISVKEVNGTGSKDECWFAGSAQAKYEALTGGTWAVSAANVWGDDNLSWGDADITYYRANPVGAVRAPCKTTLAQEMNVVEGTSGKYTSGDLVLTIGVTTITDTRNGVTMSKTYP